MGISLAKEEPEALSADDVKYIRESLELSQSGLARLLGLGSGAAKTVRRWESGETPCTGTAAFALVALRDGYRPARNILHLSPDHPFLQLPANNSGNTARRVEAIRDQVQGLLDDLNGTK